MLISNYTVEFTLLVILLVAVASLMAGVTWNFETRTARLPEATRYENLADRLRGLNSEIEDQNDKLKQLRREVQERDQVAAEIAALAAQRDNLHAEIAALADAERQIDEVKRRAADAAVEAAEIQAKVDEAQLELERTAARAIQLEREISSHEEKLRALTALPEDIQQHINELNARKQSLSDELDVLEAV